MWKPSIEDLKPFSQRDVDLFAGKQKKKVSSDSLSLLMNNLTFTNCSPQNECLQLCYYNYHRYSPLLRCCLFFYNLSSCHWFLWPVSPSDTNWKKPVSWCTCFLDYLTYSTTQNESFSYKSGRYHYRISKKLAFGKTTPKRVTLMYFGTLSLLQKLQGCGKEASGVAEERHEALQAG